MKKLKRWEFGKFKFERLKGKDALEIADASLEEARARLVNAAGVILPTKTHSQVKPCLNGLVVAIALIAFLDANMKEGDYWSPR